MTSNFWLHWYTVFNATSLKSNINLVIKIEHELYTHIPWNINFNIAKKISPLRDMMDV